MCKTTTFRCPSLLLQKPPITPELEPCFTIPVHWNWRLKDSHKDSKTKKGFVCPHLFTVRKTVAKMLISLGHSKTFINHGRKKTFFSNNIVHRMIQATY